MAPPGQPKPIECDVAIVGAGIAGAYCCYRLHQTQPNLRVEVFEKEQFSGGRLLPPGSPGDMDGESGNLVVVPRLQPLCRQLLDDLKIRTRPMPLLDEANVYFSNKDWYKYQRSKRRLGNTQTGPHPSDLIERSLEAYYQHKGRGHEVLADPELQKMTLSDFFARYGQLTEYEIEEVQAYSGFDTYGPDVSAACYLAQQHVYRCEHSDLHTIEPGAAAACQRLLERGQARVRYGHELTTLTKRKGETLLEFGNEVKCCATQVLLCLPPHALLALQDNKGESSWLPRRREAFESVVSIPCFKAFFRWPTPWWAELGHACNKSTTDLAVRQVHYYGSSTLMVYSTGEAADFWHQEFQHPQHEKKATGKCIDQIRDMHGSELSIPHPTDRWWRHWPHGLHRWRTGRDIPRQLLTAVDGTQDQSQVFVCSDAFSSQQGWLEGALEAANLALYALQKKKPLPGDRPEQSTVLHVEEYDVAVVGLGPGGASCLWELRKQYPFLKLAGFDLADRVGGRTAPYAQLLGPTLPRNPRTVLAQPVLADLETAQEGEPVHGPSSCAEFEELGASRVLREHQGVLRAASGFRLDLLPCKPPKGAQPEELVECKGQVQRKQKLLLKKQTVAEFVEDGIRKASPSGTIADIFRAAGADEAEVEFLKTLDASALLETGPVGPVLKHPEAYLHGLLEGGPGGTQYLVHGYQRLCRSLVQASRAHVHLSHACEKLEMGGDGKVLLHFPKNKRICVVDKVILCGTAAGVLKLADSPLLAARVPALEAIETVPMLKVALRWARAWWPRLGHFCGHTSATGPAQKIEYYRHDTLVLQATGAQAEQLLASLSKSEPAAVKELCAQLEQVHACDLPLPEAVEWHYWPDGAQRWREEPTQELLGQIQHGGEGPDAKAFVCGDAFSTQQGWVEGAFESVQALLPTFQPAADRLLEKHREA